MGAVGNALVCDFCLVVYFPGVLYCQTHFYYVFLSRLSLDAGTGYDRGLLIDTAIKHLPEYWLAGYGGRDPGWGPELSGLDYTDVCVNYVYLAVMYGVFGLLAYLAIICNLLFSLWRTIQKISRNNRPRRLLGDNCERISDSHSRCWSGSVWSFTFAVQHYFWHWRVSNISGIQESKWNWRCL